MKFLLAYNGSPAAKKALELATQHAKAFGADLDIMTSMEGGSGETLEEIHKVELELAEARYKLEKEGIVCETHQMARGLSPGEDLVRFASENAADHIFVGIEKVSKTRKLLLGSTAQYVILKANCPVTTVKP